jgi:hypothetical protein
VPKALAIQLGTVAVWATVKPEEGVAVGVPSEAIPVMIRSLAVSLEKCRPHDRSQELWEKYGEPEAVSKGDAVSAPLTLIPVRVHTPDPLISVVIS